jgi:uncharacterized membrane protein YeaQ/YmgE (transglycosylase-associated protein family)
MPPVPSSQDRHPSQDEQAPSSQGFASERVVRLEPSHAHGLRMMATVIGIAGLATSALMVAFAHATTELVQYLTALVPAVAGAVIVTVVVLQRDRIRLRLTEEGLEYHAFGAAVRARWEDVVALAHVEHGPFAGMGVTLRRVAEGPASLPCRIWRLVGIHPPKQAIPLSPFVGLTRGSWLEMELRRRVPTLGDLPG